MSTIRDAAYSAIPGYDQAVAASENMAQYKARSAPPTLPAATAAAIARVQVLIAAGEPVPDDIGVSLAAAESADRAAELQARAVRDALRTVDTDVAEIVLDGLDAANAHLDGRMQRLAAAVDRHAADLDGITDSATALSSSPEAAAAWVGLAPLATEYDEIRAVQLELFQKAMPPELGVRTRFNTAGLYRDFLDVSPHFRARRSDVANAYHQALNSSTATASRNPATAAFIAWAEDLPTRGADTEPADGDSNSEWSWWGEGDRIASLVRTVANAQPWVPSLKDLNDAFDAAVAATRPTRNVIPTQLEARAKVYRITGLKTSHDIRVPDFRIPQLMDTGEGDIMRSTLKEIKSEKRMTFHRGRVDAETERRKRIEILEATTRD